MPPKTRVSGRLAEKRKAEEIEKDPVNQEEDRPKKKAKIEPEKKERNSKVPKISKSVANNNDIKSQNNSDTNVATTAENDLMDQTSTVDSGRPSRRAKKVAVSKIVTNVVTADDSLKIAEDLAQKEKALQRLTTLKEQQRQIATRFEDEEYTLPDELILQILSYLKRREMYSVALACRQWYRLSNDQSLGWHLALTLALREKMDTYSAYEGKLTFDSHFDFDFRTIAFSEANTTDGQIQIAKHTNFYL